MSYPGMLADTVKFRAPQRRHRRGLLRVADRRREIPRRGADPPHAGLGRMDHRGDAQARPSRLRAPSRRTCISAKGPAARTTSAPAFAPPAAWPTIRWSATPRRRGLSARAAARQRQGRRDRLLLRRPPRLPGRLQGAGRLQRRGRLLGRQRHRRRSQGAQRQAPGRADRSRRQASTCPILGIFGNDDENPNKDQVNRTEAVLKKLGKNYAFHRYDGAGHAFFNTARVAFRAEQAADGWAKVFAFFHKHLGYAADQENIHVLLHRREGQARRHRQGTEQPLDAGRHRQRLLRPSLRGAARPRALRRLRLRGRWRARARRHRDFAEVGAGTDGADQGGAGERRRDAMPRRRRAR